MKKVILPLALATFIPGIAGAVTVNGDASVVILSAITASQTQAMNFGEVIPGTAAGIVTLSPAGAVTSDTLETQGTATAGRFEIKAQASTPLNITFGNGTVTSGGNSMTIDTFQSSTDSGTNTTNESGDLVLNVGANLNVGAAQAAGTYNGTYTVTVSY